MKKMIICILLLFLMAGCSTKKEKTAETKETSENEITEKEDVNMKLWINEKKSVSSGKTMKVLRH
ncbi:MAG: hypothetical protein VZR26_10215 [Erysipelotrichaceae bacterium]|nr:hypothetical protein [Erysipelotrichaceae bacterium]